MMRSMRKAISLCLFTMGVAGLVAQTVNPVSEFKVDMQKVGSPIQSTMYGIFFEDINFGADGGLYAELIKNRSFEFDNPFIGWTPFGNVTIQTKNPCFDRNPHYARVSYNKELTGSGLDNEGFKGIGIQAGEKYELSLYARTVSDGPIKLRINLVNHANDLFETKEITIDGKNWKKYNVTLTPGETEAHSRFRITMIDKGTVDLEHISLFPQKTFNNRPNGMRVDLAQALKDLKPGVFRFPGGCIVEGNNKATRYQWKNTVGPVENRPTNINRWNFTFAYKKFPDYYQSYGLGFFEYFQLSEDIGAEPLPVLNCGLSCQYENHDPNENCPVDKLQPYIDDALDLIEFANGPVSSKWGKIRSEMGHPEPFNLKLIAIGNEQWGSLYTERLELFVKAIRAQYPEIRIIGSSGPQSEGADFDYLWPEMKRLKVDLVDEHFYRSPEWFLAGAKRYDSYDRQGPKVFAGEYACHPANRENSFLTALCEAAFMTGLERNADVVHLCTYAPLFAHVDAWQWRPDLIWFDNLSLVKTPNYYVQQLYAHNVGTNVLSLTMENEPVAGQNDLYATAAFDKNTNELIIKIANIGIQYKRIKLNLNGLSSGKHKGTLTLLHSSELEAKNTLSNPSVIVPVSSEIEIEAPITEITLKPQSFSVYRIKDCKLK
ncbi:alpha-L-arabinofuranosidase C-terminal domain-containing protein [Parabacteroides sp. AM08-6]|uniref:alpha-L-arabinofuranosidase C-terminal domain-containing protein n=1 Tax=Parabacteroides sp. AM08-6 TaxID=2292053 RepID=UPI000EFDD0D4|nr:alpha-L-arabinofuranosidase C-terminal domain-containing protein [Parabacteroides sp. AM08-6]RHJ83256.1 alpha-L-arabinofuranosidase [Parabacteroides sp. AM08-6]